jgi:hypothetical protein
MLRRGSKGRPRADAPPPLLPGQTLTPAAKVAAAPAQPIDTSGIIARLVAYKGVGRKTAEAALQAFGAAEIFTVLANDPERVRTALGARLAAPLLAGRSAEVTPASENGAHGKTRSTRAKSGARKTTRGKRGGRGRRKSGTASS